MTRARSGTAGRGATRESEERMNEQTELKPCPFCGGPGVIEGGPLSMYVAYCMNGESACALAPETDYLDTEATAIAAWNRRADAPEKEQPTNPIDAAFEGLADFYEQPALDADVVERMCKAYAAAPPAVDVSNLIRKGMSAALAVAEPIITAQAREGYVPVSAYTALQKVLDLREAEIERNARNEVARIMDGVALIADPLVKKICDERDALKQQLATMEHDEWLHEQTIRQRDDAEETLSQAYLLITGRSPEWSNLFGHDEAIEEIDYAQQALREQLATMYTLDAVREAFFDHFSEHDSYPTGDMVQCWGDIEEALTAKPKRERVTVRRSDADEPHLVTVWLDGKEECCNMRPLHAERYATGLRAEIAAAEQEGK
jgi:hypothetical protein